MIPPEMTTGASFPAQVHLAMKALGNDTRIAILLGLADGGEKTFSQLRERHGLDPSSMTSHLKALAEGSLIRNYYKKIPDGQQYSFYDATNFGKDFLVSLTDVVEQYFAPADKEEVPSAKEQFADQEEQYWKELMRHRMSPLSELESHRQEWDQEFSVHLGETTVTQKRPRREILEI